MRHSLHHQVGEGGYHFVAGQLDINDILAMIYLTIGCTFALLVSTAWQVVDVLDEGILKSPAQDGMLVLDKDADTLLFQIVDDARPEIDNLLVDIIDQLSHALLNMFLLFGREIGEKELLGLLCCQYLEFVCILDIHNLVAYIVGCLDKIYKGVASIFH